MIQGAIHLLYLHFDNRFYVPETGLRFFWYKKFNNAMVSFLDCLKQLAEHLESNDPLFRIPHK